MIEIYFKSIRDQKFERITDFRVGSWIHIDNANLEDLTKLCEVTNLDLTDIRDSLDKYEIPRIELSEDNVLIFLRHPSEEEVGLYTTTYTIILTKSYIITISPIESKVIDSVIASRINLATTQKSKLMLFLLLQTIQDYTQKIKSVRYSVIDQEKKIQSIDNDTIIMLTANEGKLNQYLSSLVPMRALLEKITSGRKVTLYEKDQDLLEDLLLAIRQSEDLCSVNIKSIRSLRDAYQSLFTNDMNKTIKLLTAITIIFTIPTIISSIYGMNISLPYASNPYAFILIIITTIILCILSIWFFIRKKWL
jgi:magnesium transporter